MNKDGETDRGAAAVVQLVDSGELLAVANYPPYSLSTYRQDIAQLGQDPAKPLYNRATSMPYAPGSTLKPLTSVAALEEGISFPAAWRQGFAALSGEGGRILRRLEPEGDEQRILGELTWAAGELTELRRGLEQESRQREKLWFAGLFSGAGLLLILLI